jgi:hypothetical protein
MSLPNDAGRNGKGGTLTQGFQMSQTTQRTGNRLDFAVPLHTT